MCCAHNMIYSKLSTNKHAQTYVTKIALLILLLMNAARMTQKEYIERVTRVSKHICQYVNKCMRCM